MADLHESHEEQVERTVSSPEAVTEYLNGYVRPYRIWYERTAKRNYRYLSWTRSIAITTGVLATVFAACPDTVAKALSPFGTELTRYLAAISRPLRRWHPGCCNIISRKRLVSGKQAA
jgi:hypothetical protein